MDWYDMIFELIDMRSFSNFWYWIGLAVLWSSAAHRVMGVPFDSIQRAKRNGGQAMIDLEDLTRININRILYISGVSGLWLLGFTSFLLTTLVIMGFVYHVEFAQAVFLMAFPMSILGLMSISTAKKIQENGMTGLVLCKQLMRHRLYTQFLGMVSIFVTAIWGMYQNLSISALG
ncbi:MULTISPECIES: component of SufBCD complex [Halocynthiibacter]|uniref:Component of SufBCD complex n=1 Tax=Halocynthiibacter halioticoli TaxID=2986804 RepID=A0AAE3LRA4_9RHOB|nr:MULTISPECIES: component of SufBCD complex [Halocynthiibacter]MCV6824383.1 component of SufBCD complex [Halocynthiibacter halioticoli]MCW4057384.1 component of SufBCD complex [Halocynthiibacter sp. SDUM655004]